MKLVLGWPGATTDELLKMAWLQFSGQQVHVVGERHPDDIRAAVDEFIDDLPTDSVLVTFSPVALDCFRMTPECVYVLRKGALKPLTELFDLNWLAHFSLGDLYAHGTLDEED